MREIFLLYLLSATASSIKAQAQLEPPNKLSIIHVNDVHSHIDEFNQYGTDCKSSVITPNPQSTECGGGYARIKTEVDKIRQQYPDHLLLNAGDEFQGTMFYTYYKGEKTAELLNQMKFHAATIGNHEFDDGPEHLAAYLQNLTMPIVCANINTSIHELSSRLVSYTISQQYQVGIIGMITPETSSVSSPGDDVEFVEPLLLMQDLIDELHEQGIYRIIALTHIGFGADMELARRTRGISLIVGGHSHTFLGEVPWSEGSYPTVVQDLDGINVPIITNGKWGFNLGHLQVEFDDGGRVKAYSGQPIQLKEDQVQQDTSFEKQIISWKQPFLDFASEVVGYAQRPFVQRTCQITECSVGNLVADAMLAAHPHADVSLVNAGGLRAGISSGNITRGEILTVLPFGSTLVDLVFTGQELWDILEGIVSWQNKETKHEITSFAQVSGLRLIYDGSKPRLSRMSSISIFSHETESFESLIPTKNYTVCTLDFMVSGGDFWWPEKRGFTQTEKVDDVLVTYLGKMKVVKPLLDKRIRDISLKGKIKAHAENAFTILEKLVDLWLACFGEFGEHSMKVIEWSSEQAWLRFHKNELR